MTVLLVGADQLGNIPHHLKRHGFREIVHWTGRATRTVNRQLPTSVDLVLVFSDFINHQLMSSVKSQAKSKNIPVLYCKRSCCNLDPLLCRFCQQHTKKALPEHGSGKNR